MSDLIDRHVAIDALTRKMVSIPTAGEKDLMGDVNRIRAEDISVIRRLPSAQLEKTQLSEEEATSDCISRKAAIEALKEAFNPSITNFVKAKLAIENLPSAQPEIVRCKDCIFHGLCRTSTRWAVAPKDDWYCADAERRTDD